MVEASNLIEISSVFLANLWEKLGVKNSMFVNAEIATPRRAMDLVSLARRIRSVLRAFVSNGLFL